ncbi:transcription factor TFIIIB component B'' homolog [Lineus longissimus]|uniref:transcription factor TFIIIB component B'' homolog n=1 Tax=Lineus longissimus TaxID=88925 RepID=UPI002B4D615C
MRRSRLAVRPNLGPKAGTRGTSTAGAEKKSDAKTKDAVPPKSVEKPKEKSEKTPTKHVENESPKTVEEPKTAANEVNVPEVSSPAAPDSAPTQDGPVAAEKDGGQEKQAKDTSVAEVKQKTADAETKKMDKPAVPRRSRFPKARPNLSDAGRQRARTPSVSVSDNEEEAKTRHPPTVHRTAPLKVSQGQPIPCNPPAADPEDNTPQENKTVAPVPVEDAPTDGSNTPTALKPTQEKPAKKVADEVPTAKKEVKKRYKVNWGDEPPDRTKMTMRDLIHWNPSRNPMKNTENKKKKVTAAPKENVLKVTEEEERVDDVDDTVSVSGKSDQVEDDMPVPQVMIGPDGSIILNEKSLVIESTPPKLIESSEGEVVQEDEMTTTYASFRNRTLTKAWTQKETTKFYTALSAVGTDFSLVHQLFPKRTRREIKNKFKKEERVNKYLIDKALRERRHFDMAMFEKQSESEDEELVKKKVGRKRKNNVDEKENPPGQRAAAKNSKKRKKKADNNSEDDGSLSDATTMDDNASVMSEVASIAGDSDEEIEIITSIHKPTRSGRLPKRVDNTMYLPPKEIASRLRSRSASISSETGSERGVHEVTPGRPGAQTPTRVFQLPNNLVNSHDTNQLSPGKVMILTNREMVGTGPDAKEVIHVFMVTPNQQSPTPGGAMPHGVPLGSGGTRFAMAGPRFSTMVPTSPMQFGPLPGSSHPFRVPQNVRTSQGFVRGNVPVTGYRLPLLNKNISHIPATVSAPPITENVVVTPPGNIQLNPDQSLAECDISGAAVPASHHLITSSVVSPPFRNFTINEGKVMPQGSVAAQSHNVLPSATEQLSENASNTFTSLKTFSFSTGKPVKGEVIEGKQIDTTVETRGDKLSESDRSSVQESDVTNTQTRTILPTSESSEIGEPQSIYSSNDFVTLNMNKTLPSMKQVDKNIRVASPPAPEISYVVSGSTERTDCVENNDVKPEVLPTSKADI